MRGREVLDKRQRVRSQSARSCLMSLSRLTPDHSFFLNGHHDERADDDAAGAGLCSSSCMACFRLSMCEACAETSERRCSTSCFRVCTTCSVCCSAPVTWCSVSCSGTCSPEQPSNAPNTRKSSDISTNLAFLSPVQVDNWPVLINLYSVVRLFPVNLDASLIDTFAILTPIITRQRLAVYRTRPGHRSEPPKVLTHSHRRTGNVLCPPPPGVVLPKTTWSGLRPDTRSAFPEATGQPYSPPRFPA